MKKTLFVVIFILAIFLRFFKLGVEPISLDWDEASLGYNSYSLLLTGNDEFGNSWPLSIRSFNDYKPPAYSYLDIPVVAVFGLNEFSVRFPSAFFGSLTVVGVFLLTRQIGYSQKDKKSLLKNPFLPYISMFIFAISPWHLQFSRAAFEANIALFFVVFGSYFLLKWFNSKRSIGIILSAIFFSGSLYAYHAARLVVPLLILGIILRYRKSIWDQKKYIVAPLIISLILISPLIFTIIRGSASARLLSVSIFSPTIEMLNTLEYEQQDIKAGDRASSWMHNRRIVYLKLFTQNYLNHFNPVSMFLKGDVVERHHAPDMGLFYFIELPFILIGIYCLVRLKYNFKFLILYWAIIAPLPAAISTGTPHAIRSILYLPIPQIAVAIGLIQTYLFLVKSINIKHIKTFILISISSLYLFNFAYYLNQYYSHQLVEYAPNWQYGYKQLVQKVLPLKNNYDKIIITTAYDQPYIYFLFYGAYNPKDWVNSGEFNKNFDNFEFRKIDFEKDSKIPNTLLVGEPHEIPEKAPGTIDVIQFPDKKDAFRIYKNF